MRRFILSVLGVVLVSGLSVQAGELGIEATVGQKSLGVFLYEETYGGGIWAGKEMNDAAAKTDTTSVGAWAELRNKIDTQLYFAYGLTGWFTSGIITGATITSSYTLAPFVSFEYYLTPHFSLNHWTNLIQYSSTKLAGVAVNTTSFMATNLGISYIF